MVAASAGDGSRSEDPRRLHGDSPVGRDGDELGRKPFAALIARQIRVNRPIEGQVVAIVGKWGSGKSSVLRMVKEDLTAAATATDEVFVIEFNPWLFSGSQQLTALFFISLAHWLPDKLRSRRGNRISKRLRRYATAVGALRALPAVGGFFGVAQDVADRIASSVDAPTDLSGQRTEIADALRDLDIHIVVLIDDVDRLQRSEIRDLMRMVKLVGDLPGLTYVLSYDRRPVIEALTSRGISGDEYLEKIVQVEHRLPEIPRDRLMGMLLPALDTALGAAATERRDDDRWPEILAKIVEPLVNTPRHVWRYANALLVTLDLHGVEVDLVDQLALTAIATFMPSFHGQLPDLADVLVPHPAFTFAVMLDSYKEAAKARLEHAAKTSGKPEIISAVYALLFPATAGLLGRPNVAQSTERDVQRWRRVADPEAFSAYLTAAIPEAGASVAEVRATLDAMKDPDAFSAMLEGCDSDRLARLLTRLRAHVREVDADNIPRIARSVTAHARSHIGSTTRSFSHLDTRSERFVADLVSELRVESRHEFLTAWAKEDTDPAAILAVYEVSRHQTDLGDRLIGDDNLAQLQADLLAAVCATDPHQLLALKELPRLLWLTREHLKPTGRASLRTLLDKDDLLFLRYMHVFTLPAFGEGAPTLAWRDLTESLGSDWLVNRLRRVQAEGGVPDELVRVLATARHHAAAEPSA